MRLYRKIARSFCALAFSIVGASTASATSTTYIWHQTGASVPDLTVDAYFTLIDGQPFPSIDSNNNPPFDFGGLIAFHMNSFAALGGVDLSDFIAPCSAGDSGCLEGYPTWGLAFGSMAFTDNFDSYNYLWTEDEIDVFSDYSFCGSRDGYPICSVTGYFAPAPEPVTLAMFGAGLASIALYKRKKLQKSSKMP